MPKIHLETKIKADIHIVFDLSRSVDLHKISTAHTNEEAIAGRTSGLVEVNDTITWRAKHLGITQNLTSHITAVESPTYFADEMVKGAFKRFRHEHFFSEENGVVSMKDLFDYHAPFGVLGNLADALFLKKYMTKFLEKRNAAIKEFAESERWREIL
ncbi:SRPBCC family protein [Maribacter algarum]|uniref:SRPBCC family protein n=1 Tax=Maribacter algarum (ex Zhang et al. 2020) TaxID=2578118 RepID=A0A5S3PYH9_9FLAO|nr:SRPBCC family protein [Maribacter algarum]TMM59342.1 SRPBCC family protein [Maribacter algarum]